MPNLDTFSKDSIVWTNAYSTASWTLPAIVSIMTGHSPLTHLSSVFISKIPDRLPTLAEYLHNKGYATCAIGENDALRKKSLARGFDQFMLYPKKVPDRSFGKKILSILFPETYRVEISKIQMNSLIQDWLRNNAQRDFFLWIHFLDPHCPYNAGHSPTNNPRHLTQLECRQIQQIRSGEWDPPGDVRQQIRSLYNAEASSVDQQIGILMNQLKRLGIYDDALIILTSDHGEEFWEHGGIEHGHSLYNELTNVMLMAKIPHSKQKGKIETAVSTQAILPTVLQLTRIPFHDDCLKANLLEQNMENVLIARSNLYYESKIGLRWGNFQYILYETSLKEELYDLKKDPAEKNSLATVDAGTMSVARALLQREEEKSKLERQRHQLQPQKETLDPGQKEQLRTLGYVQ
jgi:arylsulfatase A-like enzyme